MGVSPREDLQRFPKGSGTNLGRFLIDFEFILRRLWAESSGFICVSSEVPRASGDSNLPEVLRGSLVDFQSDGPEAGDLFRDLCSACLSAFQAEPDYADELFRDQMRVIHAEGSGGGFLGGSSGSECPFWDKSSQRIPRAHSDRGLLGVSWGSPGILGSTRGVSWNLPSGDPHQGGSQEVPQRFWNKSDLTLGRFWVDSKSILRRFERLPLGFFRAAARFR